MTKITLYVAICGMLLTGCVSSKVERLHTTMTDLSQDVESYTALSNKSIDLNRELGKFKTHEMYSEQLRPDQNQDLQKNAKLAADRFNYGFNTLYGNKEREEAFKLLSVSLVNYFKTLPLILENKNADINGVVKSIDQLNQVIEQNSTVSEDLKEGLKKQESELIGKSLSSGFSAYQYHIFKKAIKNHYPVIMKAIIYQRNYFNENNQLATNELNKKYFEELQKLNMNYVKQSENIAKLPLRNEARRNPVYSKEEFDKATALTKLPYKLVIVDPKKEQALDQPKVKSKAYVEYCELNVSEKNKVFERRKKKYSDQTIEFKNLQKQVIGRGYFDIEGTFEDSGDRVACEFLNIVGLLYEHNFDRIELKTWEKNISEYDKLIDYVSPLYTPKKEVK
ncbi:hypothetical protein [Acinetobacter sp. ANC 3791]|uniref:hypothetical protein n=1 Tax=Acinetobacter sp. ANC 3791 TaxID=2529836 RepID=UPI00103E9EAB|nr:hypothetical protein [Acinetobacter sp. ANC 3791]TCB83407.1 hypothetical protein E0H90_11805 [Acinetobacter sp. ANC 3791]